MGNVVGWRDASRYSRYPFSEASSLRSASDWELPGSIFMDAQLRLSFGLTGAGITSLSFINGSLSGEVSSAGAVIATFFGGLSGAIPIIDLRGITCGFLALGDTVAEDLAGMPGAVQFNAGDLDFEVSTLFVYPPRAVRSLLVDNTVAVGRVVLVEGPGIALVRESNSILRVDAIGSDTTLDGCARATTGTALKTINGAAPNEYGDFRIESDSYETPATTAADRQILKVTTGLCSLTFSLAR